MVNYQNLTCNLAWTKDRGPRTGVTGALFYFNKTVSRRWAAEYATRSVERGPWLMDRWERFGRYSYWLNIQIVSFWTQLKQCDKPTHTTLLSLDTKARLWEPRCGVAKICLIDASGRSVWRIYRLLHSRGDRIHALRACWAVPRVHLKITKLTSSAMIAAILCF